MSLNCSVASFSDLRHKYRYNQVSNPNRGSPSEATTKYSLKTFASFDMMFEMFLKLTEQ